jgi:succinate dehydrogenase cytochrome b subunit
VMALSGIALMGYVLVHMIGNLHLYEGPESINSYAEALRDLGGDLTPRSLVLWVLRIGLAAAFVIHIHAAYSLTRINMKARPVRYASKRDYIAANYASRTMRWSGVLLAAFVVMHLSDLTWGWLNPDYLQGDVYNNVVTSLDRPVFALAYMISMIALTVHLLHGGWSIFQSLGLNNPRYNSWRRGFAVTFAAVIFIGNMSFPLLVSWGVVNQDDRCWPSEPTIEEALASGTSMADIQAQVDQLEAQGTCVWQLEKANDFQPAPVSSAPAGTTQTPQSTPSSAPPTTGGGGS